MRRALTGVFDALFHRVMMRASWRGWVGGIAVSKAAVAPKKLYGVLERWRIAFEAEWSSMPKASDSGPV